MSAQRSTLGFVQRAMEAGFTKEQAEFQVIELYAACDNEKEFFATKQDIREIKMELQGLRERIDLILIATRKDMESLKDQILIRLGGIMIAGMAILGFILKH